MSQQPQSELPDSQQAAFTQALAKLQQEAYAKGHADAMSQVQAAAQNERISNQNAYYQRRWTQLNDLLVGFTEQVVKYIFSVNLAGAGATLTFLGAVSKLREFSWPYIAFTFFLGGLVLAGVLQVLMLHKAEYLLNGWKQDFQSFIESKVTWTELIDQDDDRVARFQVVPYLIGYGAFACFLIGVLLSVYQVFVGRIPIA